MLETQKKRSDPRTRPDALTSGDVAKLLHVAPRTVAKWMARGLLPGRTIPGSRDRRFRLADVESFAAAHDMPLPPGDDGAIRTVLAVDLRPGELALLSAAVGFDPNGEGPVRVLSALDALTDFLGWRSRGVSCRVFIGVDACQLTDNRRLAETLAAQGAEVTVLLPAGVAHKPNVAGSSLTWINRDGLPPSCKSEIRNQKLEIETSYVR